MVKGLLQVAPISRQDVLWFVVPWHDELEEEEDLKEINGIRDIVVGKYLGYYLG